MPPAHMARARIQEIVTAIGDRLDGDWVLVGGALVALLLDHRRTTEDVDVFAVAGRTEDRYALMDLAVALGLPVEAVNSAADFFVRRVPDWREQLRVLYRGARGTVHRPTATLFVLLKMQRLSERDLADCVAALGAPIDGDVVDAARLHAAIDALPATEDAALSARRKELRDTVR